MENKVTEKKTIVLKSQIDLTDIEEIVRKKKTSLFGTVFSRPNPEDISVTSIELFYEPYWIASGIYEGDYYRKNVYNIATDSHVKEVKIGDGVFPIHKKSGGWSAFKRGVSGGNKDNKLSIPVEEHIEITFEDDIILNFHGNETKLNYKIETKHQENFPKKILEENKNKVRESSLSQDNVVSKLLDLLKEDVEKDVQIVKEKISINQLDEVFVPIYEARCVDLKNKVQILRIDGIDKKILS